MRKEFLVPRREEMRRSIRKPYSIMCSTEKMHEEITCFIL